MLNQVFLLGRISALLLHIRALPEIDMGQVTVIKRARARGDLSSDIKVLAHSTLPIIAALAYDL